MDFLTSNSFKVRARVSAAIVLVVVIGALTPNANGLRIVYGTATILGLCEIHTLTMTRERFSLSDLFHSIFSFAVLAFSIVAVWIMPNTLLIIGIILTMTSDVGAYLIGKICGTKFIHARPFPNVSPNKSWEGVIGGLFIPGLIMPCLNYLFPNNLSGWPLPMTVGCLAGLCAILGDANESALKRRYGVKDANDLLKNHPSFRHVESWLGGSEGHGGYYDRLDSMSMVMLFLGIVTALYVFADI